MITLRTEPYCENCPEFDPIVKKMNMTNMGPRHTPWVETEIRCAHIDRCSAMMGYLKGELDE